MTDDRTMATGVTWGPWDDDWPGDWKRLVFPAIFLLVLVQTVAGVAAHSRGTLRLLGYVVVVAFCAGYLLVLVRMREATGPFLRTYLGLYVLFALGLWAAHEDALPMAIFLGVIAIARFGNRFVGVALGLAALDVVLPLAFGWPQHGEAFTLAIVLAANYAFFRLFWANIELRRARAENARLAAETERQRIARDLHDLLGHSLTTVTIKAALARRLADTGDHERARDEIAQIEAIARGSLNDVRAAVSGYRHVSLDGELAAARELGRTLGFEVDVPSSTDSVDPRHRELFGWVAREALTNVARHSNATRCTVQVGSGSIDIENDGAASVTGQWIRRGPGNGLAGLRDRVQRAGGVLEAGPVPGGWRVRVDMAPSRDTGARRVAPSADATMS